MITVTLTKKKPRPHPISFALFQLKDAPKPYMVAVVVEIGYPIILNPAANNHRRQFVA